MSNNSEYIVYKFLSTSSNVSNCLWFKLINQDNVNQLSYMFIVYTSDK